MIVCVFDRTHDYEPKIWFLDSSKLRSDNYVDSLIAEEIKKDDIALNIYLDASNWEEEPEKYGADGDISISEDAKCEPQKPDKVLSLRIYFDC